MINIHRLLRLRSANRRQRHVQDHIPCPLFKGLIHRQSVRYACSNWFDRHFGIEIEMILPHQDMIQNHNDLHHYLHNMDIFKHWQTKKDNTIHIDENSNDLFGFEVISPKLLYRRQTKYEILDICNILTSSPLNAYLNVSCGFHVHCDAKDINLKQMHQIALNYNLFEPVIDGYMNTSRRANNNTHCKSLTFLKNKTHKILPTSITQMDQYLNPNGRHHKLNFCALKKHLRLNTIENRHHSGSVDAIEMLNWVRFNLLFIDSSLKVNTVDDMLMRDAKANEVLLWEFIDDGELMTYYQNRPLVDDCEMLNELNKLDLSQQRGSLKQRITAFCDKIVGRSYIN
eukprot:115483_1